jgi:ElaA protein
VGTLLPYFYKAIVHFLFIYMITWAVKKFDELNLHELYAILRLRSEVFVVEQNCVFQDMDNKDQSSYHLMGWENNILAAYTRLVPPGAAYGFSSIGRVVTSSSARGTGIGKLLMEKSIRKLEQLFGKTPIKIGAQLYLREFYTTFGFEQTGDIYDEDGIDHIEMIRQ